MIYYNDEVELLLRINMTPACIGESLKKLQRTENQIQNLGQYYVFSDNKLEKLHEI